MVRSRFRLSPGDAIFSPACSCRMLLLRICVSVYRVLLSSMRDFESYSRPIGLVPNVHVVRFCCGLLEVLCANSWQSRVPRGSARVVMFANPVTQADTLMPLRNGPALREQLPLSSLVSFSMQPQSTESAGPQSAEAAYVSKVADKSSPAAAYSSHIAADWSKVTKGSQGNGKASAAASLYLTASDSEHEEDMVYDAVSLQDSDKDFQVEVGSVCTNTQLAGTTSMTACKCKQLTCSSSLHSEKSQYTKELILRHYQAALSRLCPDHR